MGNIALDALAGTVPVLGDLWDIGFKANVRNPRLIERYADKPAHTPRESRLVLWLIVGGIGMIVAALLALTIWIISAGLSRITG